MEFLEGFEWAGTQPIARLLTPSGPKYLDTLGQLKTRGLPDGPWWHNGIIFDMNSLEPLPPAEYLKGIGLKGSANGCTHDVFVYKLSRLTLLIPALALVRGLFPFVPAAFDALFSPRGLAEMCAPKEKNGQWTVVTAPHYNPRRNYVPYPMYESLTWAWLFPSGDKAWHSVYRNAAQGRMRITLPAARVNARCQGIRKGNIVYVTSMKVAALLAHDSPYEFAEGAPHSFLLHHLAKSLHGQANNYPLGTDTSPSSAPSLALNDSEWSKIESIFQPGTGRGGRQTTPRRQLADAFIKRMATRAPWTASLYAPFRPTSVAKQWRQHRSRGQLQQFVETMQRLRPEATYLTVDC